MNFKTKHPFEKRKEEAERILAKYPQRIPVICEKDPRSRDIPNIDRQKYLVPDDLSVANFMYVIRKRIKIEAEKSIYLFVNNKVMPATAQFISTLYEKYKDEDGFLYITYAGESTFGWIEDQHFFSFNSSHWNRYKYRHCTTTWFVFFIDEHLKDHHYKRGKYETTCTAQQEEVDKKQQKTENNILVYIIAVILKNVFSDSYM